MAQIKVLTGLLASRVVPLDSDVFTIGRQASNHLELPDLSISRTHCVIEARGFGHETKFLLQDLQSANGVRVNGQTVTEAELRFGDRIQLGDCVLRFEEENPELILSNTGAMESTFQLGPAELQQMQAGTALAALPDTERYGDDLRALLDISMELGGLNRVSEIQTCFLQRILTRIPADYAAAIPVIAPELEYSLGRASQHGRFGQGSSRQQPGPGISRTILDRVLREHEAILAGPAHESGLAGSESLILSGTQAVIAAPAFSDDELAGIVYLSSSLPGSFDVHHVRLVATAARILGVALKRALASEELERENERLHSRVRIRHQIVGGSPGMARVLTDIQRVCSSDTTVLILGETGTGKELAAQAIHTNSPRGSQPIVALNCAAFTESLIESEFFGHERGSFSGAFALKRGVFEQAHRGTIFLDEIGELPLPLQAKLLRVLENREIRRVGGEKAIPVDFRLVAATHRDLREAVKTGSFRADLFYRLDVVSITIPPLRERRQDILPLAEHFLAEFRRKTPRQIEGLAESARLYLERYDWPGNVRELRNAIERAVIAGASPCLEVEDLPDSLAASRDGEAVPIPYKQALLEARRRIILSTFQAAEGKHTRAAELLGVHPNNLHRMLNELGIREQARRAQG